MKNGRGRERRHWRSRRRVENGKRGGRESKGRKGKKRGRKERGRRERKGRGSEGVR